MPVCLALQAAGTADGTGSHLDFPLLRRCAACNLQILAADVFIYSCFLAEYSVAEQVQLVLLSLHPVFGDSAVW